MHFMLVLKHIPVYKKSLVSFLVNTPLLHIIFQQYHHPNPQNQFYVPEFQKSHFDLYKQDLNLLHLLVQYCAFED